MLSNSRFNPAPGLADFWNEFRRPNPYRWPILVLSIMPVAVILYWAMGTTVYKDPERPTITYITTVDPARSDAEIAAENLANQEVKDLRAAELARIAQRKREMYKALGAAAGGDAAGAETVGVETLGVEAAGVGTGGIITVAPAAEAGAGRFMGAPAAGSSIASRVSICDSALACSSERAVSVRSCPSNASSRTRISVTAVVAGAPMFEVVTALPSVPGAICGSKNRPSAPGNTLRCKARTSDSILRMRASAALSCAITGTGAVTIAAAASATPTSRSGNIRNAVVMDRQAPW